MKNANFKNERERRRREKEEETRKRREEIGREGKRNVKLHGRRGKEAEEDGGEERYNITKWLFLYVGFMYSDAGLKGLKNFITIFVAWIVTQRHKMPCVKFFGCIAGWCCEVRLRDVCAVLLRRSGRRSKISRLSALPHLMEVSGLRSVSFITGNRTPSIHCLGKTVVEKV
jgi:hypothetical protein